MARVNLRESYKHEDITHMLHGATVPSEFAKSVNRIYVEGHGVRLVDIDGKEYLDAMSSGLVNFLGYGNQELVEAARVQMGRLHCAPSFANRTNMPEIDLARKLADITPPGIKRFMFTNSGSDANDSAFKIVRWYWREQGRNKYKIISLDNAYHGATYGAMSATSFPGFSHKNFEPFVPGFLRVPNFYCYRCPLGKSYPSCDVACAEALEKTILQEGADTVGAFLCEPVETSAGTLVPPPEYWPRVMEICKKHSVFLIIDEYITGFGRMGKFWAGEYWSIRPDLIMFAKGLASGYLPMACIGITEEIYKGMTKNDIPFAHVFTYGGHPVGCAVALKNIEIIERENLVEKAEKMGVYIKDRLKKIQKDCPYLGDVRGMGLYFGLDLVSDKETRKPFAPEKNVSVGVRARLYEKGLIVGGFGPNNITLGPPLIITKDEIDCVLDGLEWGLKTIEP
jgi:adenosylmethionine-8-amino-7-oxononanoate aminotransferase